MASWSPISLWVFIYGFFNTRRYTIVRDFCLFKLFLMGEKELVSKYPLFSLSTPSEKFVFLLCNTDPFINGCVGRLCSY